MKALSIRQPWAWLIVNNFKTIENRDWRYQPKFRGRFLVHAGKRFGGPHRPDEWEWPDIEPPASFDMGGIRGIAELVDVVTRKQVHRGSRVGLGLVLRNARPLKFYPCKGMLGFFDVDYPHRIPRPPQG